MSHESRLLDLVVAWEELRAAGRSVTPEEFCAACPELLDEFQRYRAAMAGINKILEPPPATKVQPQGDADADQTSSFSELRVEHRGVQPVARPVFPGYEILEELGRGSMGVVFKARQVALDRIVALKTILGQGAIRDDDKRRFLQEARAMAHLQHPNIVQIHEVGELDGHPYLVMEYVPGTSLREKLAGNPLPPRQAAQTIAVVADAIQAAHAQTIIHRDLKPSNILVEPDGTLKICDFGLAKCLEPSADQTRTGQLLGTPNYMAPEQVLHVAGSQGPAVDIYALGVLLYECLTGRPPFLADNPLDTLQLVTGQEPVPPRRWQPRTPADLETICLKCLEKTASRRYPSAAALADELRRFLAGEPIQARPVGPLERAWRWCRTHPARAGLFMVMTAAAIMVVVLTAAYNHLLTQELLQTDAARQEVLHTEHKLQRTLTRALAERLDGDLRELAGVPLTMATLLENRADWDEEHLDQALKGMLGKSPRIFGLCVAFEPQQWRKGQDNFAHYVYRRPNGLAVKQLVPPDYRPLYRDWQWYRAAKVGPQTHWTEPYIGEGGDRTPMVTFSAPICRQGRFVGVVTADLAMDYFRELWRIIDRLDMGPKNYCFVVSAGRRILAHPAVGYQFPSPHSELAKLPLDASFQTLVEQWTRSTAGAAQAVDFSTGQSATFLFSRVPSSDWTLLTVVE